MFLFKKKKEVHKELDLGTSSSGKRVSEVAETYVERIDFCKLEYMYHKEPLIFGGINLIQKAIAEAGFVFSSKDETTQRNIDDILEETDFVSVITEKAPLHLCIAGNCFIEYIWDVRKQIGILNLKTVDFKTMDFIREEGRWGRVALDDKGRVKGWLHKRADGKEVEFNHETMQHLTLNQLHEGMMGIGLIEPCYTDVEIKENLEKAMGELVYRQAFPLPAVKYGVPGLTVTSELRKSAENLAKDMADPNTTFVVHGYGMEPYFLQQKSQAPALETNLNILNTYESACLGIPLALILQTGMYEQRATLEPLIGFFEITVKAIQKALKADIIMKKILISKGIKQPKFDFEWKTILTESMKEKAMRLRRLAQAGLLEPDEFLKDYLRKIENLPKKK